MADVGSSCPLFPHDIRYFQNDAVGPTGNKFMAKFLNMVEIVVVVLNRKTIATKHLPK